MTVSQFLSAMGTVLAWIFTDCLPTMTSAIVSNGILLTVVIISLLTTVIFTVLGIINAVIGRKNGGDD